MRYNAENKHPICSMGAGRSRQSGGGQARFTMPELAALVLCIGSGCGPTQEGSAPTQAAPALAQHQPAGRAAQRSAKMSGRPHGARLTGDTTGIAFNAGRAYLVDVYPISVSVGDFNGDGKSDLAVCDGFRGVSVLLGDSAGGFGGPAEVPLGESCQVVVSADFDGDGFLDLAAITEGQLRMVRGDGSGGFGKLVPITAPAANQLAVGDFNRDGISDLVAAGSSISVLLGNPAGTFPIASQFDLGGQASALWPADLDGDGSLDLAVAGINETEVRVLFGDGLGGFRSSLRSSAGNQASGVTVGDFNGDGRLDLAISNAKSDDVSVLLANAAGGFGPATSFGAGQHPAGIATSDLDGDGKLDLVVGGQSGTAGVLRGNGTGGFAAPAYFGPSANGPVVGDFNYDGHPDVVAATGGHVNVLLGDGTGGFVTARAFRAGLDPAAVAVGDYDGDRRLDLAVVNQAANTVTILPGSGAGSFGYAAAFPVGTQPAALVSVDVNQDGKLDLAVANSGSGDVSVLLNDGKGSFGTAGHFATGMSPTSVVAGDLDGDGKLDLVVANSASNNVTVLRGDGTGQFAAAVPFSVGDSPNSLILADFNADGKLDLAVADQGLGEGSTGDVRVLLGDGAGGFAPPVYTRSEGYPTTLATADFNADGKLDLAIAYDWLDDGDMVSNWVQVALGDGRGSFSKGITFEVGLAPSGLALGDFDGDGNVDLATANNASDMVSVLRGMGNGSFTVTHYLVGSAPSDLAVGDFDGDGRLDLAVTNRADGTVSAVLNRSR